MVAGPETARRGKALVGPIYLKGAGDPVLATRSYAAAYLGGRATRMSALALPLRRRGIRLVRGPIIADERIFDSRGWGRAGLVLPPLRGAALRAADQPGLCGQRPGAYVTSPRWPHRPSASRPPWAGSACPRSGAAGGRRADARAGPRHGGLAAAAGDPARDEPGERQLHRRDAGEGRGRLRGGRGATRAGRPHPEPPRRRRSPAADRLVDGSGCRATTGRRGNHGGLVAAADADPDWGAALLGSLARGGEERWCAASPAARPQARPREDRLPGRRQLARRPRDQPARPALCLRHAHEHRRHRRGQDDPGPSRERSVRREEDVVAR